MPWCPSAKGGAFTMARSSTLARRMLGDRPVIIDTFKAKFNEYTPKTKMCDRKMNKNDLLMLKALIDENFFIKFNIDNLPFYAQIGNPETSQLFTHYNFEIFTNGPHIISAAVTMDTESTYLIPEEPEKADGAIIPFYYSVQWKKSDIAVEDRLTLLADLKGEFFQNFATIRWIAVMNAALIVVALVGIVAVIVRRILHNDYTRYEDAQLEGTADEYGWKLVHGDVFRIPKYISLLSGFFGLGVQFLTLTMLVLLLALAGFFIGHLNDSRYVTFILCYAITSCISGAASTAMYKYLGGTRWSRALAVSSVLFIVPTFLMVWVVNAGGAIFGTTSAIETSDMIAIVTLSLLVYIPSTFFGGIFGRRIGTIFTPPCRTNQVEREIPAIPWYRKPFAQTAISGILPFSAIFYELSFIFRCVWGHNVYSVYGILFIVFILLLIVTVCVNIVFTYFQLSSEDHHWWWSAFMCGGAPSVFIFIYGIHYFFNISRMHGYLQASFFFGYLSIICYFLFIMLGSAGFLGSFIFVKKIYARIKID
eukprot:TRINITY_DN93_c0_g2_i2.p1 TRINITY_DN93_c0_g2~~TRINITY_DN93_c0_g2_i2.p1  ORF type:complete len:613 (-),score=138.05 TRINITY_DN93_c0_g2_i2:576-2180(-)